MPDLTLNDRASLLVPDIEQPFCNFTDDLNDAAALWEAAPEEVKAVVIAVFKWSHTKTALSDELWTTWELYLARSFLNPAALTKAVVEKWEEFNAKEGK